MTIKPIRWVGAAREEIQSLPDDARKEVGFALWTLQQGIQPSDFKPMSIVGKGVEEIRIRTEDAYRVYSLHLQCGEKDLFVDLAAEKFVTAEKAGRKIAVEVKSFIGVSPVTDLEKALGQYILYQDILEETEVDRVLYLAIRQSTYKELFCVPIGMLLLKKSRLRLIVFNPKKEEIVQWIP